MNYKLKISLSILLAASSALLADVSAATNLLQVYQRAQQSDPSLREADATRMAARENKPQAIAALLPQLYGTASAGRSETDSNGSNVTIVGSDPVTHQPIYATRSTNIADTRNWGVQLNQTIFAWDQWSALKRADAQVAQAEATYRAAQQDLVFRVATLYFNVLSAKDTLDANQAASEAFGRQLEQADKRFEVGLIAITDVQEARAAKDSAAADVIAAKRALASAEEQLRAVTGEIAYPLAEPDDNIPLKSPDPASEDQWVHAALDKNFNLQASRLASDIASANVSVARGGHLPTLSLTAAHLVDKSNLDIDVDNPSGTLSFPGSSNQKINSVGLQLNFPFYSGGATSSRVRQQVYLYRAAREHVELVSRQTESSARDLYQAVTSNISRVKALKQALESSQTALQATEAGFDVGTRTTVDVLLARRTLYSAQTAYARSRYDYILSAIQLKQTAGSLSDQDVVEINGWLKEPPPPAAK